jgi:hypothetical protein
MRASRASQGFRGLREVAKSDGNPKKWHKNQKIWAKTCGNRVFAVDKAREKTQGKRR